jgi:dolichol-phosphate mannosyltransferase
MMVIMSAIPKIAVVIPSYRVRQHIFGVLAAIGKEVWRIYIVDDCCPEGSGDFVRQRCSDHRVRVLKNEQNQGVGGAVMTGYRAALAEGADIIVKIDGDGQMDPTLLIRFVTPIIKGQADYTKGNRFYDLTNIRRMPIARLFGNAILSFMTKFSTGYWNIFDPTNGYTAIHARVAAHLPLDKINRRYFFETDMLFRLNIIRAVVVDIPMDAVYNDEKSSLKIRSIVCDFSVRHVRNFVKRIAYNYFLRDMTLASVELIVGNILLMFGLISGALHWSQAIKYHTITPLGTIMLSTLPTLLGLQFLLAFLGFDVANLPKRPVQDDLPEGLLSKYTSNKLLITDIVNEPQQSRQSA